MMVPMTNSSYKLFAQLNCFSVYDQGRIAEGMLELPCAGLSMRGPKVDLLMFVHALLVLT